MNKHVCGLCDGDGQYVIDGEEEPRTCIRCGGSGRVTEPKGAQHGD